MVYKTKEGYKVKVWDDGYVTLCELIGGEWVDCVFDTEEDAEKARKRYYGWE